MFSTFKDGVPTILIKGSGRCANLVCDLLEGTDEETQVSEIEKKIDELFKGYRIPWNISDEELTSYKDELVNMCREGRKLLYIFNADSDEQELDYHILHLVIQNSNLDFVDQLQLTVDMNCCNLAKTLLSKGDFKSDFIDGKLLEALKEGQTEFVELFLDYGSYIEKFLTKNKLVELYDHASKCTRGFDLNQLTETVKTLCQLKGYVKANPKDDKLPLYGRVISKLAGNLLCNPYAEIVDDKNNLYPPRKGKDQLYTELDLFYWAILLNRMDLVQIFWRMGKDHIGAALVACGIFRRMHMKAVLDCELELSKDFSENSEYFEKMAYDILSKAYERDKVRTQDLLFRALPCFSNETLLSLADQSKCMEFLSHSAVQTKLNHIWMGDMNPHVPTWKIVLNVFCPLFFIRLIFPKEQKEQAAEEVMVKVEAVNNDRDSDCKVNLCKDDSYIRAVFLFYNAPITKFIISTMYNIIFLTLMSYMTIVELRPYPSSKVMDGEANSTADEVCSDFFNLRRCISPTELIIWFWFFTLVMEEIRQLVGHDQQSIFLKLQDWWSIGWNKIDVIIYIFFIIAIIMRFALPQEKFQYNRNMYAVIMALFFMRFMQAYYANRTLGPKVVMINKMMNDIAFFVMIFVIFLLAYGTAAQAIMYPNSKLDIHLIKNIFHTPYFQVYGELNLEELENIEKHNSRATQTSLVIVMFAFYLLLTNVLMLNLLIAMFGYTFQRMQDISVNIWAYKRRNLIFEYVERPVFGPPLNLYSFIYRLIRRFRKSHQSQLTRGYAFRRRNHDYEDNRKMSLFEQKCMELVLADRRNEEVCKCKRR